MCESTLGRIVTTKQVCDDVFSCLLLADGLLSSLTWITIIVIVLYTCINMRQLFDWLATIQKKLYQHVNGAAIVAWNLNVSNLNDFNEKTFEDETQR